jgi:hypothetical protein
MNRKPTNFSVRLSKKAFNELRTAIEQAKTFDKDEAFCFHTPAESFVIESGEDTMYFTARPSLTKTRKVRKAK